MRHALISGMIVAVGLMAFDLLAAPVVGRVIPNAPGGMVGRVIPNAPGSFANCEVLNYSTSTGTVGRVVLNAPSGGVGTRRPAAKLLSSSPGDETVETWVVRSAANTNRTFAVRQTRLLSGGITLCAYTPNRVLATLTAGKSYATFVQEMAAKGLTVVRELMQDLDGNSVYIIEAAETENDIVEQMTMSIEETGSCSLVRPDHIYEANVLPNDTNYADQWALAKIGAPQAWDTRTDASSVLVAVLDTGVNYNHFDLNQSLWMNDGEIPGDGLDNDDNGIVDDIYGMSSIGGNVSGDSMDDNGHGSHCAGIIGAGGNNRRCIAGVAWKARIMGLKFLDEDGRGSVSDAITCLRYAEDHGARIVNCSFGSTDWDDYLYVQMKKMSQKGTIFACAAGNASPGTSPRDNDEYPFYPCNYLVDTLVGVAATDSSDALANFSYYGAQNVDIAAPGVDICSTVLSSSGLGYKSGTSMATPHVAGALALLAAHYPDETSAQIIDRLYAAAEPVPALAGKVRTGSRLSMAGFFGITPPTEISVSQGTVNDAVVIYWAAVAAGTHYRVWRAASEDGEKTLLRDWQQGLTFSDETAEPGVTYWYYLQAASSTDGASASTYSIGVSGYRPVIDTSRITVSFNPSGGTVSPASKVYRIGQTYAEMPTPTYSGKAFLGWFTEASGGTRLGEPSLVRADATTLYAHWIGSDALRVENLFARQRYPWNGYVDVTFDLLGVPEDDTASVSLTAQEESGGSPIALRTFVGPAPTNLVNGAQHVVWNATPDTQGILYTNMILAATVAIDEKGILPPQNVTATSGTDPDAVAVGWSTSENATSYEVWRATANNLALASKIASPTTTSYSDTSAVPATTYWYWVKAVNAKKTSEFSASASGSRKKIVTAVAITGSASVTAGGTATYTCTATYNDNNTATVTPTWTITSGSSYASINSSGVLTANGTATQRSVTIQASYSYNGSTKTMTKTVTINTKAVTISFNANGGSVSPTSQPYTAYGTYNSLPTATAPTGYTFAGWWTASSGGTQVTTSSTVPAAATTLWAHWTANTYTVTLDQQSGSGGTASVTVTYGSAMPSITVPTRTGYTFGGYYTGINGSGTQYYTASGASAHAWDRTSATTLYAKWTERGKVQLWEGGPYWAETNIGAETPEDYGYYFWWGDTVGYKRENNAWVASDGSSSNFSFSDANTPTYGKDIATLQSEGWITSDGVLASEHDAAHVHWGGNWRMPTDQELSALINNCDWTWTTMNGVNGYVVRGRGGYAANSIFLPAAGFGRGASLSTSGSDGDYWSSVPYSDYGASGLYFYSGDYLCAINYYRYYGFSVRPVQGFTVTLDQQGGSGGTASVTATYGSAMPSITVPTLSGYTFGGYYTGTNGSGTQYYTASGASARTWDRTSATTLYAKWISGVQLWEGGPCWADKNIGAEKPEDSGYYFWWGDTVGYRRENEKWVASDGSSSNFSFSEANMPTYNKDVATLKSEGWITSDGGLAPEHDAAHVKWGGAWRMPTYQELSDLNSKCDLTWTTMNGVNGYVVCGKGAYASNNIFLPCAGYGLETLLGNSGSYGLYWSSVPYSDYYSLSLYLGSGGQSANYGYYRYYGFPVRPVQGFTSDTKTVMVSFDANGGSVSPSSQSYTAYGTYGTLPTPTRAGYTFAGWWTASSGGTQVTASSTVPAANATLFAHWVPTMLPDLYPYTPAGWSGPLVLSASPQNDTTSTATSFSPNDIIYASMAVVNSGAAFANDFNWALYVDGSLRTTGANWGEGLSSNGHSSWLAISIGPLSVGTHTIRVEYDYTGLVSESNESNNTVSKTVTVSGTVVRPDNDNFANATMISGASGSVSGSNVNATCQSGEPLADFCADATNTIWWAWTAPASGTAQFNNEGSTVSDTVMGVYTGSSVSSLATVSVNDNYWDSEYNYHALSSNSFSVVSGMRYYIAVSGSSYEYQGAIQLNWSMQNVLPDTSLATALDNQSLTFTTGGNANWEATTAESHVGGSSAKSGAISDSQTTWMQTEVSGEGTLSFWYKVSSESGWDKLIFYIDGIQMEAKSGTDGWAQLEYTLTNNTQHVFKWVYSKDGSVSSGSDCCWIDKVEWTPFVTAHNKVQLWEGGPYWATTNIGAETPEDYGYYFWWGDTVGYKRENEKWVASDGSSSDFSFGGANAPTYRKYIATLQSEGWITSDGVLASEHDAAHVHWGGNWRMPTDQELSALINNCDWTWTTMNGVNGYVVRGRGAYAPYSIFLPCAGYGNGTSLYFAGSYGYYWSSIPYSDYSLYSWNLSFHSGDHGTHYLGRDDGRSIRPVQGVTE